MPEPASLFFTRASDQGEAPYARPPSARRARAAVAGCEEVGPASSAAAAALLAGAQSRHAIFREELVRKAYYAAEAAHRGQVLDRAPLALCLLIVSAWPVGRLK